MTTTRRRLTMAGLALAALALGATAPLTRRAEAHAVLVGVGTTSTVDVRPRRIIVQFNLGFSSLLALGEMTKADANKDRVIEASECDAYLAELEKKVVPTLRLFLDGKRLELHPVRHWQQGMVGPIDRVSFETYFDLEAAVDLGTGSHELVYHDGSYEDGQDASQRLFVATDRVSDFESLESSSPSSIARLQKVQGAYYYEATRDVTVKFDFRRGAIERDKAEALLESALAGIEGSLTSATRSVARAAEADLSPLACGTVKLGGNEAPTAGPQSVVVTPNTAGVVHPFTLIAGGNEENEEAKKMADRMKDPFTILTLLAFFGWGALHAKGPGHGKTMVAAYLLGTAGKVWDAVRLGLIVTFTHTFTLYTLGLGLVALVERLKLSGDQQQTVANKSIFYISLASGLGLSLYGLGLAVARRRVARRADAKGSGAGNSHSHGDGREHEHGGDGHSHSHSDGHSHNPQLAVAPAAPLELKAPAGGKRLSLVAAAPLVVEAPAAPAAHSHDGHSHDHAQDGHSHDGHSHDGHSHDGHSHDGHSHDHAHGHGHDHAGMSEDAHAALHAREAATKISSLRDLLSLGISSGIVPCPAGITLIVLSLGMQSHNTWKCFVYLNAFSLGLGATLVAIAVTMVLTRSFIVKRTYSARLQRLAHWVPVYSALAICVIGLGMAAESFDPGFNKTWARMKASLSSNGT